MTYYLITDKVFGDFWDDTNTILNKGAIFVEQEYDSWLISHRKFILEISDEDATALKLTLKGNVDFRKLDADDIRRYADLKYIGNNSYNLRF